MKKKRIILLIILLMLGLGVVLLLSKNGNNTFVKDGVTFALTLDGDKITEFPDYNTDKYSVTIDCENGTGKFIPIKNEEGKYEWQFVTEKVTGNVKCFIDYKTITEDDYVNNYVESLEGTTQGTGEVVSTVENIDLSYYVPNEVLTTDEYVEVTNDATYAYTWSDTTNKWTTTNTAASTTSTIEFKVSEAGNYRLCSTISSGSYSNYAYLYVDGSQKIYIWATTSAAYNSCHATNLSLTTDSVVKIKYNSGVASSVATFYLQKQTYVEDIRTIDAGIRYNGKHPNNFVSFNNELWRMMGSVPACISVDADGSCTERKNLVKIIRNLPIGGLAYDAKSSGYTGLWGSNTLYTLLNNYYFDGDNDGNLNGTGSSYCYGYSNTTAAFCDYTHIGILSDSYYGSMVEPVYWDIGAVNTTDKTNKAYINEMKKQIASKSYIGLMSASDYGYSATTSARTDTALGSMSIASGAQPKYIWLNTGSEWLMTQYSGNSALPLHTNYQGKLMYPTTSWNPTSTYVGASVRPVLYLDENVYIMYGDGTSKNPYVLGI